MLIVLHHWTTPSNASHLQGQVVHYSFHSTTCTPNGVQMTSVGRLSLTGVPPVTHLLEVQLMYASGTDSSTPYNGSICDEV